MGEDYREYKPYKPDTWPGDGLKAAVATSEEKPGFAHLPPGSSQYVDHPSHAPIGIHPFPDRLHVVTVVENPLRWRSRYWNYHSFEAMVEKSGAILYTVEVAFGDRPFEVTSPTNPRHLQLRTYCELLHKENAINLGIARLLPASWRKVAWIDADVQFTRPDWAQETLQLLEHYDILQMFSQAVDLNAHGEFVILNHGFVWNEVSGLVGGTNAKGKKADNGCYGYYPGAKGRKAMWHPGYAWAARRRALDDLGGLMDWVMGGSADHYMARALFNKLKDTYPRIEQFVWGYQRPCFEWQSRAQRFIRQNVGYMEGTVYHMWHGPKNKRGYMERAAFLAKTGFNPVHHLKRDWQGLYQLNDDGSPNSIRIRDGLRLCARLRDEDSKEEQTWLRGMKDI